MCGPIEAAVAGSTVMNAGMSILGGNAQASALNAQAGMYDRAATIEQQNKGYNVGRTRERRDQVVSQQETAFADNGLGGQSVAHVTGNAVREAELEVLDITREADEKIAQLDYQAAQARANAQEARKAGQIGVVSALVGGAKDAYTGGYI